MTNLTRSGTNHEHDQPSHLKVIKNKHFIRLYIFHRSKKDKKILQINYLGDYMTVQSKDFAQLKFTNIYWKMNQI